LFHVKKNIYSYECDEEHCEEKTSIIAPRPRHTDAPAYVILDHFKFLIPKHLRYPPELLGIAEVFLPHLRNSTRVSADNEAESRVALDW
ncbi:MAG: hypothetical protein QXI84_07290, partial [Thermofilaceae archaeon]